MSLLSIGEFASLTGLSVKTLRRYHAAGLLDPAHVDEETGYRSYSPDQLRLARTVRRLRELDLPVREIAELLGGTGDDLLLRHVRRLEERQRRTQESLTTLRRLTENTGCTDLIAG